MTTSSPRPLADMFRDAFRAHPAGVAVLTADAGQGPVALTVSSLISLSPDPAMVAFSLSSRSSSAATLLEAGRLVIHMVRWPDIELARGGATSGIDRFAEHPWERLADGEPRYTDVENWFRARIAHVLPLEGATLVVAELLDGHVAPMTAEGSPPLVYHDRLWHSLPGAN